MIQPARLMALVVCLVALSGCDRGSNEPTSRPPPLTELRLGYFANVTHAQAVLGVSSGDFQAALNPIHLQTKVFNAGPELIQALDAGAIDIGYVGPGPAISADVNSRGQAIRVISGAAANGVVIVASPQSGIHSLSDLKGKLIATPQVGNTQDVSAKHYVLDVLHQANTDNVKEVRNSQQAGMMARGKIDAAWVPEPWGARLIDETGAVLVGEEKDLWPHHQFSLTVVVTTPTFLAEHPDVVRKFLAVHHRWTLRLQTNAAAYADQLNDALVALGGARLPLRVVKAALKRTIFTDDPLPQTFKTMEQWSYDLKFINAEPDLAGLFDIDTIQSLQATTQP